MSRTTPRPLVPALIILFLFVAVVSPAPAIGASWSDGGTVASLFARLWGSLAAFWGEVGCVIDGNGGCQSGAEVERDAGCWYDPNGRCQP